MLEVYDLETFREQFLYCSLNVETKEIIIFEVSDRINQIGDIYVHLSKVDKQIGYNNIHFDSKILKYILDNKNYLLSLTGSEISDLIYKEANRIIESNEYNSSINIPQLDLFKLHHFDRFGVSLKYVGFGLKMPILMDLPFSPGATLTNEQKDIIYKYVSIDVLTTYELYKYSESLLKLRKQTHSDYGIVAHNLSNTAVARNYFINTYSKKSGISKYDVKNNSTKRDIIKFKDVISDKISFKTPLFQNLLESLKESTINLITEKINIIFKSKTITSLIRKGGLHSSNEPAYYESNNEYKIIDIDAQSYYPNLLLQLQICPAHLNKEIFLGIIKELTEDRIKAKNNGNTLKADNYKIKINSIFGE